MRAHTPPYTTGRTQYDATTVIAKTEQATLDLQAEPLLSILADYHAVTRRLEAYIANKRLVAASDLMQDTFRAETLQGFGIGDVPEEHPLRHISLTLGDGRL